MSKIKAGLYGLHAVRAAWDNPARDIRALYHGFRPRASPVRPRQAPAANGGG